MLAKCEEYEGKPENQNVTRVKDDWFFRNVDANWMNELKEAGASVASYTDACDEHGADQQVVSPPSARDRTLNAMREVIEAVAACATENEAAYIAEMSVRLYECRRVLKDTGSIYVHCDHHANSYLRMLMDAIFGKDNFRNQIVWGYEKPRSASRKWRANHDTILFYVKNGKARYPFNPQRMPTLAGKFEMRKPFKRPDGTVWEPKEPGKQANDWWYDIPSFATAMSAPERTGYATQKPLALYQRIIRASSNPGDVVLDLFAGCATTAVAAELEGRNWLACDMAYRASTMFARRLENVNVIGPPDVVA